MKKLFVIVIFLCACSAQRQFKVTPNIVTNDCSFAVDHHDTFNFSLSKGYSRGWFLIQPFEVDTQKLGKTIRTIRILNTNKEPFEYWVFETVMLNGKVCNSVYVGVLEDA